MLTCLIDHFSDCLPFQTQERGLQFTWVHHHGVSYPPKVQSDQAHLLEDFGPELPCNHQPTGVLNTAHLLLLHWEGRHHAAFKWFLAESWHSFGLWLFYCLAAAARPRNMAVCRSSIFQLEKTIRSSSSKKTKILVLYPTELWDKSGTARTKKHTHTHLWATRIQDSSEQKKNYNKLEQ